MNQVKQIHKLRSEGYGIKTIAAMLGISKNTVKSYLRKTDELGLSGEQLMATDNPILADQLKPVSAQEKDNYQAFLQRAEHYVEELAKRKQTHVTRMILWEEDFHRYEVLPLLLPPATLSEEQAAVDGHGSQAR